MEDGDLGEQQLKMIMEFGHGADRGAGGAYGPALIDGNGRRDAFDGLNIRLVHAVEKLPRVGGKTLDVAALAFGVENIEGERGFARAADTGDDGQLIERNLDVEVLEIILPGAADVNCFSVHRAIYCKRYFSVRMRRKREP